MNVELFRDKTREWFAECIGESTQIQKQAWPAIASGQHTLVSAPTGTGKTLSAFLVFIDRMLNEAKQGVLQPGVRLLYISPLKSLAGDIRENLKRPMEGIWDWMNRDKGGNLENAMGVPLHAAVRTGDTSQSDRRKMLKSPPHILITTPESLFLLLTSKAGKQMLSTTDAVIVDELHALIDTKRGAHLMLSLARLDALRGKPVQRIGLSATIDPLEAAAAYLVPEKVQIAAPKMHKDIEIKIVNCLSVWNDGRKNTVWERMAEHIYRDCHGKKSVIAFVEGRRAAEKLAFQVNELAGEGFAKTHHGSMSKEQRSQVEEELRQGKLRLLCATSSMELGIDVGDVERVLQVGCPKSISSTLQRLGRAGHNPGRVSLMVMYPKTAGEALFCGLTAQVAKTGGVESVHPPTRCLDVLAQHLVSMAVGEGYTVDEVMEILQRTWTFREVTREEVKELLQMLAGDYEHAREIPVRPRILYNRLEERVEGDAYSRMLAVSAGGTIPDRGLFAVRTEGGVKLGEVDEEFVYEARIGDRFLLGSFAWKIINQDKDNVYVEPASVSGATLPFWKGDWNGRGLQTAKAFGSVLRGLSKAMEENRLEKALLELGFDREAAEAVGSLLERQKENGGVLPDDKTILIEHFRDSAGVPQLMIHSIFGRRVNAPLALLLELEAREQMNEHVSSVEEENGVLLYPYGDRDFPEGLLVSLSPDTARQKLETILPGTSMFQMAFRYNAARALMMGAGARGRQPLWLQRMRSAGMLESLINCQEHPLIRESKRECLEDQWDIAGVEWLLKEIRDGSVKVKEVYTEVPSALSLPLQWAVEAAEMYNYVPMPAGVAAQMTEALKQSQMILPDKNILDMVSKEALSGRTKLPEDEKQLHSLLMIEGDLQAGELNVPVEWLENLAAQNQAAYVEPGLWIAAEQLHEYEAALNQGGDSLLHIIRRALRYRGAMTVSQLAERYFLAESLLEAVLSELCAQESIVRQEGYYYHADLYDRARRETLKSRRQEIKTLQGECYAAYLHKKIQSPGTAKEQLKNTLEMLLGTPLSPGVWEEILLPGRVENYREANLDALLAEGELFWQMHPGQGLAFYAYEDIDWDAVQEMPAGLSEKESLVYAALERRGASFMQSLNNVLPGESPHETLLLLMEKGLVRADSYVPVRQWLEKDKIKKAAVRQRVNVRVKALHAGRWEITRPLKVLSPEENLKRCFERMGIVAKETLQGLSWAEALKILRIREYTGQVRRGYFVEGLSGAQFIREEDFARMMSQLGEPSREIVWLSGADPAQIYGKILPHKPGCEFMNLPGVMAAFQKGKPIAVFEKQGKILRIFEDDRDLEDREGEKHNSLEEALAQFAEGFQKSRIFPKAKRITVKEYPSHAAALLQRAGFRKEMLDYVLYR